MIKSYNKAFTLIELLVVVAIIGILSTVGVVTYNGYIKSAKNSQIKSNHQKIKETIKADIAVCYSKGGKDAEIVRLERTGGKTFKERKYRCRDAFSNQLIVHFLFLGLQDPTIQDYDFYKPWTYNGRTLPNDASAAWFGVPTKQPKYHPAYWVGKTWIEQKWVNGNKVLILRTYLMDEVTKIEDTIEIPFK